MPTRNLTTFTNLYDFYDYNKNAYRIVHANTWTCVLLYLLELPLLVTVPIVPDSGMLTLYVASSLILSTPHYVITPWLHIFTPQYVVTPQLCHYSVISQSHVYILEFYLGEPQLELTWIQRVPLHLLRSSVTHTPLEHWHLLVLSAHSNTVFISAFSSAVFGLCCKAFALRERVFTPTQ